MVPLTHMSQLPNGISIGSADFPELTITNVTNRQTDTQTDHDYAMHKMRPKEENAKAELQS